MRNIPEKHNGLCRHPSVAKSSGRTSKDLKGQSDFSPEIEGKQCGIRKGRDHARPWSPYKQFGILSKCSGYRIGGRQEWSRGYCNAL